MSAEEIVYTAKKRVACAGSGGALGHPKVYLEMGDDDKVVCPYCSRTFIYQTDTADNAAP